MHLSPCVCTHSNAARAALWLCSVASSTAFCTSGQMGNCVAQVWSNSLNCASMTVSVTRLPCLFCIHAADCCTDRPINLHRRSSLGISLSSCTHEDMTHRHACCTMPCLYHHAKRAMPCHVMLVPSCHLYHAMSSFVMHTMPGSPVQRAREAQIEKRQQQLRPVPANIQHAKQG